MSVSVVPDALINFCTLRRLRERHAATIEDLDRAVRVAQQQVVEQAFYICGLARTGADLTLAFKAFDARNRALDAAVAARWKALNG